MYRIVVSNQCSCFKKSELKNNQRFPTSKEALEEANKMLKIMNNDFCEKHEFELQEMYNNFVISFYNKDKKDCCGNGCCF